MNPRPVLLFGYGNPGRGDDALGPLLVEAIEKKGYTQVECLSDMQLQIEHVTDLAQRTQIVFVDADTSCDDSYEYSSINAEKDESYSSHSMTPSALLYAYRTVYGEEASATFLLRIRGYNFALGSPLSKQAETNLDSAQGFISRLLEPFERIDDPSLPKLGEP